MKPLLPDTLLRLVPQVSTNTDGTRGSALTHLTRIFLSSVLIILLIEGELKHYTAPNRYECRFLQIHRDLLCKSSQPQFSNKDYQRCNKGRERVCEIVFSTLQESEPRLWYNSAADNNGYAPFIKGNNCDHCHHHIIIIIIIFNVI